MKYRVEIILGTTWHMESVASAAGPAFQTWKMWGSFLARLHRRGDIQFGTGPAEMDYKCELFPASDKIVFILVFIHIS
jgi:hypothetical protein